jgi:5-methylcytosine-specific restriction endonuclease McrA
LRLVLFAWRKTVAKGLTDTELAEAVASLPTGRYRRVLGLARRLWRQKRGKSPRLPRTIRMTREDERWAQEVIMRDGACVACGATEGLEAAHIISRRYRKLRHSPDNGITLCHRCHRKAHSDPTFLPRIVTRDLYPPQREGLRREALAHYGGRRWRPEWDALFGGR